MAEITQEKILELLNAIYEKTLTGLGKVGQPVEDMANNYLKKYSIPKFAAQDMLKNQQLKCATSGFLTGFGGVIVLPVAIPANIGSVLYVQMRMIACTAYLGGYDINSDQVQTLTYACLAGISVNALIKDAAIKAGIKAANKAVERLPGQVLARINKAVGFRLLTKFGEKGIINLGKIVPVAGAVIGGGFDYAETKIIAKRAYKWFIEGDFDSDGDKTIQELEIIEVQE